MTLRMTKFDINGPKSIMLPYETNLFNLDPPASLSKRFDNAGGLSCPWGLAGSRRSMRWSSTSSSTSWSIPTSTPQKAREEAEDRDVRHAQADNRASESDQRPGTVLYYRGRSSAAHTPSSVRHPSRSFSWASHDCRPGSGLMWRTSLSPLTVSLTSVSGLTSDTVTSLFCRLCLELCPSESKNSNSCRYPLVNSDIECSWMRTRVGFVLIYHPKLVVDRASSRMRSLDLHRDQNPDANAYPILYLTRSLKCNPVLAHVLDRLFFWFMM